MEQACEVSMDAAGYRRGNVQWCYEKLGFSFVALDGKRPTQTGWQSREREALDEALAWAEAGNVGLRTGEASGWIVVIDVDSGGDVSGLDLPETVVAVTGSGGRHYYFRTNRQVGNSVGRLGEHIDVRGDGGQVVFAGSVHPETGQMYAWLEGHEPWQREIAELPEHIIDMLDRDRQQKREASTQRIQRQRSHDQKANRYASFIQRAEVHAVANAVEGARNDTLNKAAFALGRLIGAGYLDRHDVEQELQLAADRAGLDWHEAQRTIRSGLDAGVHQPRVLPAERQTQRLRTQDGQVEVPKLPVSRFRLTASGNADRFMHLWGQDVHWCEQRSSWYVWDGACWREDEVLEAQRRAELTVLALLAEAEESGDDETIKWATRCNKTARPQSEMLQIARHRTAIHHTAWDRHDWLLGVQNGVIDLRSGELLPHDRDQLITRLCATVYDPRAACPQWEAFLGEVMAGDAGMIAALQRLCGYCLTGDISVQVLPILYGSGANGKNVFLDTFQGILGAYGAKAPDSLITAQQHEQHPTEIADLMGRRLVVASETDEGRRLRIGLVKQLTGDATLKGRFMRQDFFEFRRTHKTLLVTNNKPVITEASHAVWRRIRLIPFEVTIPEQRQDKHLPEKLRREWPGILAWAVRGCLDWQQRGGDLGLPEKVTLATDSYRGESDPVGQFIDECCLVAEYGTVAKAELYEAFSRWAKHAGEYVPGGRTFNARVKEKGFEDCFVGDSRARARGWRGLMLAGPESIPGNPD